MSATVLPFHRRRAPRAAPDPTYSQGWIDGARYVERWRAWGWRAQGFGVCALLAIVAFVLFTYFGGHP